MPKGIPGPHVPHRVKDSQTGGIYLVMAYKKLSKEVVEAHIRTALQDGAKRPKKGQQCEIRLTDGIGDPL